MPDGVMYGNMFLIAAETVKDGEDGLGHPQVCRAGSVFRSGTHVASLSASPRLRLRVWRVADKMLSCSCVRRPVHGTIRAWFSTTLSESALTGLAAS